MAGEKILDIDDSPTVQRLIEMILASQGYQVVLASDGEEGIAKARSERPEVILVDFVMPKMNGFQVCKILKEDPEFRDTPIILVTSRGDKVGSKFVDVLGITEYFTKPFQPEELLAKIREVIDRKKQAPPPPPAREIRKETRPAAFARQEPASSATPGGIEGLVRSIVAQALEDFAQNTLPGIIQQALARGGHGGGAGAGIQGNLASVRIAEVMQMLGLQRQTGKLVINSGRDAAEIYFKDGLVVFAAANCNGGTAVEGLLKRTCRIDQDSVRHALRIAEMTSQPIDRILVQERLMDPKTFADCLRRHTESVVYKAMAWKEGDFSFENAASPVSVSAMQLKVDDLLLEGARRADEWTLIQQKIPDFNMVFEPMIGNAEELTTRGMSEMDLKVFSLINGRRSVQEIVDMLCLGEFDVAKSMFILLSVNLIRRRGR
jgi:CheY-like chemotaxis protein